MTNRNASAKACSALQRLLSVVTAGSRTIFSPAQPAARRGGPAARRPQRAAAPVPQGPLTAVAPSAQLVPPPAPAHSIALFRESFDSIKKTWERRAPKFRKCESAYASFLLRPGGDRPSPHLQASSFSHISGTNHSWFEEICEPHPEPRLMLLAAGLQLRGACRMLLRLRRSGAGGAAPLGTPPLCREGVVPQSRHLLLVLLLTKHAA